MHSKRDLVHYYTKWIASKHAKDIGYGFYVHTSQVSYNSNLCLENIWNCGCSRRDD